MQTSLFLSVADHAQLTELLYHRKPGLFPVPESYNALTELLAGSTKHPVNSPELHDRVGLGDRIRLEAPEDPADFYEPSIVMPSEADLEKDRLSVLTPLGFAVLGRQAGQTVAWATPRGHREMKIASINKPALAPS